VPKALQKPQNKKMEVKGREDGGKVEKRLLGSNLQPALY